MFLAIFEPPILPISFIYILGLFTAVLLLTKYRKSISLLIVNKSGIANISKFIFGAFCYLSVVGLIDTIFIEPADLMLNRLRCINQLVILSFIQFLAIWYIFRLADELGYRIKDIFRTIFIAGALQGICALAAYIVPDIRKIFIRFGDATLFNNAYFIERRGYGFSMTLIDTFGYGMGLMAGYLLLLKWESYKLWRIIGLALMLFAIAVNARTGIIIFAIAVVLKVLQGGNKIKQMGKIVVAIPIMYVFTFQSLPKLLSFGEKSTNITIKWIATDMQELYSILFCGNDLGNSLTEASFFSNFGNLPQRLFEFIWGSGHSIYDTTSQLGFRTDVGYINLWWEFGLLGLLVLLLVIFVWMAKPLTFNIDVDMRSLLILNLASYFMVLFKAILIGYNPGVFVTYLCVSAIYYYADRNKCSKYQRGIENYE